MTADASKQATDVDDPRANGSAERWVRRPAGITTKRALRSTTRAGIYEHLRRSGEGQTVRDIAHAFSLHPNVARTHLETLADAGLVVVSSRKHPGGGRPAKVYLARPEAGDDEIRLHAPTGGSASTAVIRMLGEVIANGQGAQNGTLETLRQVATKQGVRLGDHTDAQPTAPAHAADVVVRLLRAEGYLVTVDDGNDDTAFVTLDNTKLSDWLDENVPSDTYPELHAILTAAYRGEFGLETDEQSALNMLYLIGSDEPEPFQPPKLCGTMASRLKRSAVSATFSAIIHDSCGALFTASGRSVSALLTSVTSPATGLYSSETAFTDSMVPKTSPLLNVRPTSGSSRNTSSPSCFCA